MRTSVYVDGFNFYYGCCRWWRAIQRQLARWPRFRPLAAPRTVAVLRSEEKGSDVNLATQWLLDAVDHRFDCAAVVSNDSDLLAPIRALRQRFGRTIGLLSGTTPSVPAAAGSRTALRTPRRSCPRSSLSR
jgi:uncharacterized LabA/DUF88 family protein